MANKNIVKLKFCTPLHLSRGQTDAYDKSEEILHSDSLKSAIFVAAKMLFGNEIANLETIFDSFKVSSAFPYKGDEFFFPKPMAKLNLQFTELKDDEDSKKSKKLKKLEYIGKSVFERVIAGEQNIIIAKDQLSKNGKFLFSSTLIDETEKAVHVSEVQQRLATAKPYYNLTGEIEIEKDGTPYYIDRIYFTQNAGLYFFIEYAENADENQIKAAIKLLGDEGIGTDKHVGNGIFEPEFTFLNLKEPLKPNFNMLLSLYCPEKQELSKDFLDKSAYQLIKRGGYIASPEHIEHLTFRKKSVYMFQESSVFPIEMPLKGKKVDLKPQKVEIHNVWRDGNAFSIPFIKIENQ